MLNKGRVLCIISGKIEMSAKLPSKNDDLARKKALETLLEETKASVEAVSYTHLRAHET